VRKLLAALLLAAAAVTTAGPATASTEWEANFRRCEMDKWFSRDVDAYEFTAEGKVLVSIKPEELPAIEKGIAILKKCNKFWTCVREREDGARSTATCPGDNWTGLDMKKLLAMLMLAAAMATPAMANAASLPKGLAGTWCGGETDEKGEIPYGRPTEDGKCQDAHDVLIIAPGSYRITDGTSRGEVCRFEKFGTREFGGGLTVFVFTAKCPTGRDQGTGWFQGKALNIKWQD